MSTWLDTIMTPLNAANQSVQKLIEIRDAIKFGEEVGKLHSQILTAMTGAIAAKADQATLLDEIGDLKKKVAELEGWETEKEKYELIALAPYVMAFRKKQSLQGSDPPYYICATCYNAGKKNYLKQTIRGSEYNVFKCHSCGDELPIHSGTGTQKYASREPRGGGSWMSS